MGRSETLVHLKYTSAQLRGYVSDPNSCVRRLTDRLHIGLPPAGLANFKEAVVNSVNREKIGQFDARLDGIVLDVRNIKVLGGDGFTIHTDHPELHIDMLADLHVFRPTIGAAIRGVIKHIAKGHISVTIHRVFNVAIRLTGTKQHAGLAVNAEITIKVTDFDLKDSIPYIAGELALPLPLPSALKKSTATAVKTKLSPESGDEFNGSDSEDDNRSVMVDTRVTIKKEPRSGSDQSDSETSANDSDHPNDDNDSDAASDAEVAVPMPKFVHIKQEKLDSEDDSEDSGAEVPERFPIKASATPKSVKHENSTKKRTSGSDSSDSSSADEPTVPAPTAIKRELGSPSKRKSISTTPVAGDVPAKRKRLSAIGADSSVAPKKAKPTSVANLLQSVLSKHIEASDEKVPTTPIKSTKRRHAAANDSLLGDITAFSSPSLSSTLLPESLAKRGKKSKAAE